MSIKKEKSNLKINIKNLKTQYKQNKKSLKISYKKDKKLLKDNFKLSKNQDDNCMQNDENSEENAIKEDDCPLKKQKRPSKRYLKPAPERAVLEEIGNAVTHGIGAILSIVAFVLMTIKSDTVNEYIASAVYSFGLFIMFLMSCLYHSFKNGSTVKNIFRHFDYMCIYLLIGATFAPILLCFIGGTFGLVFFILQWAIIITGITLVGVFGPSRLKYIHFPLYFVIGWSGLIFIPRMISTCLPLFWWILAGGVIYSVGMIPFALNKKVAHFIWHFFVLFGALAQWIGIYYYIYLV